MLQYIYYLLLLIFPFKTEVVIDELNCTIKPIPVTIDDLYERYRPRMILLHRCVGSFDGFPLSTTSCAPSTFENISISVVDVTSNITKKYQVVNETSCKKQCKILKNSCSTEMEVFDENKCICKCKYDKNNNICKSPMVFINQECTCKCSRRPTFCKRPDQRLNISNCQCECNPNERNNCIQSKWDEKTCSCTITTMYSVYSISIKYVFMISIIEGIMIICVCLPIYRKLSQNNFVATTLNTFHDWIRQIFIKKYQMMR